MLFVFQQYIVEDEDDYWRDNDTDTDEDEYQAAQEMSTPELQQYLGDMSDATYDGLKGEYLWAKKRFRTFGKKSSRFTRFPRKSWSMSMSSGKGKRRKGGKRKGKGKRYHFEPSVINHSSLAGGKNRKGKGKGKGKFGGKMHFMTNPTGGDGKVMKCHECQSETHLIASCPNKKGGKGKSKGKRFMTETAQPSQFAFQPGALHGIVNGQTERWFIGEPEIASTTTIEEVNDDDWWTAENVGMITESASSSSGTQLFAITDERQPQNFDNFGNKRTGNSLFFPSWQIVGNTENPTGEAFLVRTRMATAPGMALLVDPGSPENLCGDQWSKQMQEAALAANRPATKYSNLERPLEVGGIGSGTQSAYQSGTHSIGLPDGTDAMYESPILPKSGTPALLGQKSLKKMRCLLDCFTNKLYRCGPGGYNIKLSPGSVQYDLEESHAGHLMLPCSRFNRHANEHNETQLFASGETVPETTKVEAQRFSREERRPAASL